MPASAAVLPMESLVEVAFPAWPTPVFTARAVAPAAPREWATQREAGAAALIVAGVVGVPVVVAVGTILTVFALTTAVLLAPLLAVGLAWIAWHFNTRTSPRTSPPASP